MTVRIDGMHCAHCISAVTQALMEIEGVTSVTVDLDKGTAQFDGWADEARLREATLDAGFDLIGVVNG